MHNRAIANSWHYRVNSKENQNCLQVCNGFYANTSTVMLYAYDYGNV